MRVDVALVARELVVSREKGRRLIEAGLVSINGNVVKKPSMTVTDTDELQLLGVDHPYVGRGGLKLQKALEVFHIDPFSLVCMDIGASTGGFTDVLIKNGARKVYAIDVGEGQLHPSLLSNPRVVNMEHVNARALSPSMFSELPTLAVMDVSFISIQLILPQALPLLGEKGRMVTLVKPQFEAGRRWLNKKGIVSDPKAHTEVLSKLLRFLPSLGWALHNLDFSPITGGDGNIEFLADLLPASAGKSSVAESDITRIVAQAHQRDFR